MYGKSGYLFISLFALFTIGIASITGSSGGGGGDSNNGSDGAGFESDGPVDSSLMRSFALPIPLFSSGSAWRQSVSGAGVLANSSAIIEYTYGVLTGNSSGLVNESAVDSPYIYMNYDEWTVPIFNTGSGANSVYLCEYEGDRQWPSPKFGEGETYIGGPVSIPAPAGTIRPSDPVGINSDGWLVLFDQGAGVSYDFWQASTQRNGECQSLGGGYAGGALVEAGAADFFSITGDGSNLDGVSSARAVGTPLLAGLLTPEDIASGAISHALAYAVPGPRNLGPDPSEPIPSDYAYPATTTETDHYSTNTNAMIAGQRIRLKGSLVDMDGNPVDESQFSEATRMFLTALREYGAINVDNAGGFIFYAEDAHTGWLDVSDERVDQLTGGGAADKLASGKSKWQVVTEKMVQELSTIPICNGSTDNFDVVAGAVRP